MMHGYQKYHNGTDYIYDVGNGSPTDRRRPVGTGITRSSSGCSTTASSSANRTRATSRLLATA
eukprot:1807342-Prymnesium_polylepis.1